VTPDGRALAVAAAAALLFTGLGAGALLLTADRAPPEPYEPTATVPADVDYVGTLNLTTYRSDPAVANGSRASLGFQSRVEFYDGPPFPRALALSPPENASLESDEASHVTYFGRSDSRYGARLVVANWTGEAAAAALGARRGIEFTTETRRGYTVRRSDAGAAVAVLDDGAEGGPVPRAGPRLLAIGNASAVEGAVDVAADTADPDAEPATLDGDLRRQYRGTPEGYVRFAYRFRPLTVPDYPFVGPAVRTVQYVGSSYSLNRTGEATGDGTGTPAVRVRIHVTSEDPDSARDVRNALAAGQSFYLLQSSNGTLNTELRRVGFARESRTVVTEYESSPAGLRVLVRGLFRNQPEPQSLDPPAGTDPSMTERSVRGPA
jgi:hypothetical protein